MSVSDKTVQCYLDLLTGSFMVRQLQPWFENLAKHQVKAPKVHVCDLGLLHSLPEMATEPALLSHPEVGASGEGFAIDAILWAIGADNAWFWATRRGAELDLLVNHNGCRVGFEVMFSETPTIKRSAHAALDSLGLKQLCVICPSRHSYSVDRRITVRPMPEVAGLRDRLDAL